MQSESTSNHWGYLPLDLHPVPISACVKDLHVQSRGLSEDPGSGGVSTAEAGQQNITLATAATFHIRISIGIAPFSCHMHIVQS